MGGTSSKETTQHSQTEPWAEAKPVLTGILEQIGNQLGHVGLTDTENAAFNTLQQSAQAGNPYASQFGKVANNLLSGGTDRTGMVNDAFSQYQRSLAGTANGDYLDPNKNPFYANASSTIGDDVMNRIRSAFAGAGRSFSGAETDTISRAIAKETGGLFADQYNKERQNQINAQNSLYGAGGQTAGLLSGLDQQHFGNQQAGIGVANAALQAQNYGPNAQLLIEAQKRGITPSLLAQLAAIATPIAALGNQSSGQSTTTYNASPMELISGYTKAFSNLLPLFGGFGGGVGGSKPPP
jgi:hypothetical protein